jgi:hypothetical protein
VSRTLHVWSRREVPPSAPEFPSLKVREEMESMRQADIERGRSYINWPETATRTVTSIRGGIIYFREVRHDWRPPRHRCRFERFAGWAKREVDQPLPERRVRPLPKL